MASTVSSRNVSHYSSGPSEPVVNGSRPPSGGPGELPVKPRSDGRASQSLNSRLLAFPTLGLKGGEPPSPGRDRLLSPSAREAGQPKERAGRPAPPSPGSSTSVYHNPNPDPEAPEGGGEDSIGALGSPRRRPASRDAASASASAVGPASGGARDGLGGEAAAPTPPPPSSPCESSVFRSTSTRELYSAVVASPWREPSSAASAAPSPLSPWSRLNSRSDSQHPPSDPLGGAEQAAEEDAHYSFADLPFALSRPGSPPSLGKAPSALAPDVTPSLSNSMRGSPNRSTPLIMSQTLPGAPATPSAASPPYSMLRAMREPVRCRSDSPQQPAASPPARCDGSSTCESLAMPHRPASASMVVASGSSPHHRLMSSEAKSLSLSLPLHSTTFSAPPDASTPQNGAAGRSTLHLDMSDTNVTAWLDKLMPDSGDAAPAPDLLSLAFASVGAGQCGTSASLLEDSNAALRGHTDSQPQGSLPSVHNGLLVQAQQSTSSVVSSVVSGSSRNSPRGSLPSIFVKCASNRSSPSRRLSRRQSSLATNVVEPDYDQILKKELSARVAKGEWADRVEMELEPAAMSGNVWLQKLSQGTHEQAAGDSRAPSRATSPGSAKRSPSAGSDGDNPSLHLSPEDLEDSRAGRSAYSFSEYKAVRRHLKSNDGSATTRAWSISGVLRVQKQLKDSVRPSSIAARGSSFTSEAGWGGRPHEDSGEGSMFLPTAGDRGAYRASPMPSPCSRSTPQRVLCENGARATRTNSSPSNPPLGPGAPRYSQQRLQVRRRESLELKDHPSLGGSMMLDGGAAGGALESSHGSMVRGDAILRAAVDEPCMSSMCVDGPPPAEAGVRALGVARRSSNLPRLLSMASLGTVLCNATPPPPDGPNAVDARLATESTDHPSQFLDRYAIQPVYFLAEETQSPVKVMVPVLGPPEPMQPLPALPRDGKTLRRSKYMYAVPFCPEAGGPTAMAPPTNGGAPHGTAKSSIIPAGDEAVNANKKLTNKPPGSKKVSKPRYSSRGGKGNKPPRRVAAGAGGKGVCGAPGAPAALTGWGGVPQIPSSPQVPFLPLALSNWAERPADPVDASMSLQSAATREAGERTESTFWNVGVDRAPGREESTKDGCFGRPMSLTRRGRSSGAAASPANAPRAGAATGGEGTTAPTPPQPPNPFAPHTAAATPPADTSAKGTAVSGPSEEGRAKRPVVPPRRTTVRPHPSIATAAKSALGTPRLK